MDPKLTTSVKVLIIEVLVLQNSISLKIANPLLHSHMTSMPKYAFWVINHRYFCLLNRPSNIYQCGIGISSGYEKQSNVGDVTRSNSSRILFLSNSQSSVKH